MREMLIKLIGTSVIVWWIAYLLDNVQFTRSPNQWSTKEQKIHNWIDVVGGVAMICIIFLSIALIWTW